MSAYRQARTIELARLNRRKYWGPWCLALFLLLSTAAWYRFPFLPSPSFFTTRLGSPPAPAMVTIAFLVYTFFAIVLNLARMMSDMENYGVFNHLCLLGGFYFFYFANDSLDDNFWAVFASGITILIIESYRIHLYCRERINHIHESLANVEKTGRLPLDD